MFESLKESLEALAGALEILVLGCLGGVRIAFRKAREFYNQMRGGK